MPFFRVFGCRARVFGCYRGCQKKGGAYDEAVAYSISLKALFSFSETLLQFRDCASIRSKVYGLRLWGLEVRLKRFRVRSLGFWPGVSVHGPRLSLQGSGTRLRIGGGARA